MEVYDSQALKYFLLGYLHCDPKDGIEGNGRNRQDEQEGKNWKMPGEMASNDKLMLCDTGHLQKRNEHIVIK